MIKKYFNIFSEYFVSAIFAVIFFIFLYGVKVLDVTYDDFLIGNYEIEASTFGGMDSTQHYYGWRAYREADWQFPIGCYDTLTYPSSTSIIFTDSLPLLAVPFKAVSFILPDTFQYFGMWGLLCFVLQGIMSIRILRHYTTNKGQLIIMSLFFVTVPMFLWRMFMHTALDSQWILLMALEPLFSKDETRCFKNVVRYYIIVAMIAASVHIYLLFYCGIILVGYTIYKYMSRCKWYEPIILLMAYVLSAAVVIALLGGFSVTSTSAAGGLEACSMNLNSMVNSEGYSMFLPGLPQYVSDEYVKTMQFEGYCYLGLGGIALILISGIIVLVYLTKRRMLFADKRRILAVAIVFMASLFIALSPTATIGNNVLYHITFPDFIVNLWSIFRSTGRTSWILVYLIIILSCIVISKIETKSVVMSLLIFCIIIQLMDNFPIYNRVHSFFYGEVSRTYSYKNTFEESEFWDSIAYNKDIEHIVLGLTTYPYDGITLIPVNDIFYVGLYPLNFQLNQFYIGDFAISNHKTLNYFLVSRNKYDLGREYVLEQMCSSENQENYLYVFWEENKTQAFATGFNVYYADGLYIAYDGELNNEYLLNSDECTYYYDFTQLYPDGFSIDCDLKVNYACCELARGEYVIKINSKEGSVIPLANSALHNVEYDIEFIKEDDSALYYLSLEEDDSTICMFLGNNGDDPDVVYDVSITRIE